MGRLRNYRNRGSDGILGNLRGRMISANISVRPRRSMARYCGTDCSVATPAQARLTRCPVFAYASGYGHREQSGV